jgi:hypothetical protein
LHSADRVRHPAEKKRKIETVADYVTAGPALKTPKPKPPSNAS